MRSRRRIGGSSFQAWHVEHVRERDDLEGVAAGRTARRVHPVDVPRQQGDELGPEPGHLFRGDEHGRLDGIGHVPHQPRILRPDQLEPADAGEVLLEEHLLQRSGRRRDRRVVGLPVDRQADVHQPPGPLPAVPAAGLLDEAEPGQHPQVVGARGGGLTHHVARLRRGHRARQSDRF
jgi:hypothetical protein